MGIKLDQLDEQTVLNSSDIMHLRTVGGLDKKISGANIESRSASFIVETAQTITIGDLVELLPNGKVQKWTDDVLPSSEAELIGLTAFPYQGYAFLGNVPLTPQIRWETNQRLWGIFGFSANLYFAGIHNPRRGDFFYGRGVLTVPGIGHGNRSVGAAIPEGRVYLVSQDSGTIRSLVAKIQGPEGYVYGTSRTEEVSNGSHSDVVCFDDNKVLLTYFMTSDYYARLMIMTISDLTITPSNKITTSTDQYAYPALMAISNTEALLYGRKNSTGGFSACVVDLSGSDPSPGTQYELVTQAEAGSPITNFSRSALPIDATHYVMICWPSGSTAINVITVQNSSGVLSRLDRQVTSAPGNAWCQLVRLTPYRFLIMAGYSTGVLISINPSTYAITLSTFNNYYLLGASGIGYSDREVLLFHNDTDGHLRRWKPYGNRIDKAIGIAGNTASAGNECRVILPGGLVTGLTGLTQGKKYSWDIHGNRYDSFLPDFQYRKEDLMPYPIAIARSSTELIVLPYESWK